MERLYRMWQFISVGILFIGLAHPVFSQTTININCNKDNTIFQESGMISNGIGQYLFAGNTNVNNVRRTLVAFDVAGVVPAGAEITNVTLNMFMSVTVAGDQTVELRRILANWGEGTSDAAGEEGQGAQATTGDATWSHSIFNTTQWQNAGGDFAATVSASQTIGGTGSYTWGSTSQMVADVQGWLDNPAANFGWLLIGNEDAAKTAKRFVSRENSIESNRPVLTVTYSTTTNVENSNSIPKTFSLSQNYPNPFSVRGRSVFNGNPVTEIWFNLPTQTHVILEVYSILGHQIKTLVSQPLNTGQHTIRWDGRNEFGEQVNSGIYFYRIKSQNFSDTKRMILLK